MNIVVNTEKWETVFCLNAICRPWLYIGSALELFLWQVFWRAIFPTPNSPDLYDLDLQCLYTRRNNPNFRLISLVPSGQLLTKNCCFVINTPIRMFSQSLQTWPLLICRLWNLYLLSRTKMNRFKFDDVKIFYFSHWIYNF